MLLVLKYKTGEAHKTSSEFKILWIKYLNRTDISVINIRNLRIINGNFMGGALISRFQFLYLFIYI